MNIWNTRLFLNVIFVSIPLLCSSQINQPKDPAFDISRIETSHLYYINSGHSESDNLNSHQPSSHPGINSNDIIAQQNARVMQQMGYRGGPVLPPSDPTLRHQFIVNQSKAQNNTTDLILQEVLNDLNEVKTNEEEHPYNRINSKDFKDKTAPYEKARLLLSEMLNGKIPLSLKDAFYILESTYGDTHLNYNEFTSVIKKSADFIKHWLSENGYDNRNNVAMHLGIQAFMKDTLTISKINKEESQVLRTVHYPFAYDYIDFRAEEDFRNYFVTKTLATGFGQCNSLPATYLLLAEQLGAPTYLSYAPLHSFVKFPDNKGNIHNYEVTSHYQITDQWYSDHFGITTTARRNRIYLDTLNSQQIVAGALMDLAFGYLRKYGVADGHFINECVSSAIRYFPNQEANVQGWLLRATVVAAMLHRELQREQIRDLNEIRRSPQANELYNQLLAIEGKLRTLGYQELPTEIYQSMTQDQDNKASRQRQVSDTKTNRDLFITHK